MTKDGFFQTHGIEDSAFRGVVVLEEHEEDEAKKVLTIYSDHQSVREAVKAHFRAEHGENIGMNEKGLNVIPNNIRGEVRDTREYGVAGRMGKIIFVDRTRKVN